MTVTTAFDQVEPRFVREAMVRSLRQYRATLSTAVDTLASCGYPATHIMRHLDDVCAEVFGTRDEQ